MAGGWRGEFGGLFAACCSSGSNMRFNKALNLIGDESIESLFKALEALFAYVLRPRSFVDERPIQGPTSCGWPGGGGRFFEAWDPFSSSCPPNNDYESFSVYQTDPGNDELLFKARDGYLFRVIFSLIK